MKIQLYTKLGFAALLFVTYAQAQVLYQTDFSNPTLAGNGLSSGSQDAGFRDALITNTNSETYFGVADNNYLYINRQSGGSSDAASFSVSGTGVVDPSDVTPLTRFAFDLNVQDNGAGRITFASYVGSSSSAIDRTLELRLDWSGSEVRPNNTATAAFAYNTAVRIELFTNNSSETISYQSPTGTATLDSAKYSLFVDGVLKLENTSIGTGHGAAGNNGGIGSFTFSYFGTAAQNYGTIRMDNFEISEMTVIPEARHGAALIGGAVILLAFLRRKLRR